MPSINDTFITLFQISLWDVLRWLYLIFLLLYITFAGIIVRQVKLMSSTVGGVSGSSFRAIALIHLGVAILIFFLAIFFLRA
ncbi:MAG: DUF5657 family protein [Patescibacteria group bacterium]|jgi:hypothetical protein